MPGKANQAEATAHCTSSYVSPKVAVTQREALHCLPSAEPWLRDSAQSEKRSLNQSTPNLFSKELTSLARVLGSARLETFLKTMETREKKN